MQILDEEDNLIVRHGNTLPYKTPYLCIRAGEYEGKRFYVTPEAMMAAIDAAFFTTANTASSGTAQNSK